MQVDVFAFGVILWELWAMAPPYASEAAFGGLLRAVTDPSRHVRPLIPGSGPDAPPMPEPGREASKEASTMQHLGACCAFCLGVRMTWQRPCRAARQSTHEHAFAALFWLPASSCYWLLLLQACMRLTS